MKQIRLDENRNPYMPSPSMKKTLYNMTKKIFTYPEMHTKNITKSIANVFSIEEEYVAFGNGSMELFKRLVDHFGDVKYGFLKPSFWGFKHFLKSSMFQKILECELEDILDLNLLKLSFISKQVDVFYLCNPNNPTLDFFPLENLLEIIKSNPQCHFIIDETLLTYEDFNCFSLYKYVKELDNLSVVISLSKVFGIAGLRCGIIFSNKIIIKEINTMHIPFLVNIFTENLMVNNLNEFNKLEKIKKKIYNNYSFLINSLPKAFYSKIINRNSCFLLVYTNDQIDLKILKKFLDNHKIILRYSFELSGTKTNFIRISAGKKRDYNRLIRLIKVFIREDFYDKYKTI